MLVHLLLWFYISSTITFSCKGFEELPKTKGKYRPDRSFTSHYSNSLFSPNIFQKKSMANVDLNNLVQELRDDWEDPGNYLEKRGYLSKPTQRKNDKENHKESDDEEAAIRAFKEKVRKLLGPKGVINNEATMKLTSERKLFSHSAAKHAFKKQSQNNTATPSSTTARTVTATRVALTTSSSTPIANISSTMKTSAPEQSESKLAGILTRFRNKFESWIRPTDNVSSKDNSFLYNDIMNEEVIDNKDNKETKQKFFDFKYDDAWLQDDDWNRSDLENGNKDYLDASLVDRTSSIRTATSTSNDDLSTKFGDVLKNFTQADIDYVKNFLSCYKENKAKFFIDYLKLNRTQSNQQCDPTKQDMEKTNKTDQNETNQNETSQNALKTTGRNLTKISFPAKKVEVNSTDNQTSTAAPVKEEDNVKLDIDIQTDDPGKGTGNRCSNLKPKIPADVPKICVCLCAETSIENEQTNHASYTTTTLIPQTTIVEVSEASSSPNYNFITSDDFMDLNTTTDRSTESPNLDSLLPTSNNKTTEPTPLVSTNLLRFLAHQHHSVSDVGRLPTKRLNLTYVQAIIDGARDVLATVIIGNDTDGNVTKCTPVRLKELNYDLELTSQREPSKPAETPQATFSLSPNNAGENSEDIIDEYLSDSSFNPKVRFEPPYSDKIFISDCVDRAEQTEMARSNGGTSHTMMKKKRDIALPEELSEQDGEDDTPRETESLNPESALRSFGIGSKHSLILDDYLDDYSLGDLRERKKADPNEEDDNDDETEKGEESELFGRKKKKKRKRKKKKKKKKYNKKRYDGNKVNLGARPYNPSQDPAEFVIENELPLEKEATDEEPQRLDHSSFAELNDIKFQVNTDQEEAIDKFIEGLNAPPEVFNFDIERFLKPKSEKQPLQISAEPQKTFYEFHGAPAIENEQIPFIAPDTTNSQSQPETAVEPSSKESGEVHRKRDILRQYIKAISEHLHELSPARTFVEEKEEPKLEARSMNNEIDRDQALMTNYASDLDALNYGRFDQEQKEAAVDDFVDKFYLLNDGSPLTNAAEGSSIKPSTQRYNPPNLDIDLELDRKFKDLDMINPPNVLDRYSGVEGFKDVGVDIKNMKCDNTGLDFDPEYDLHKDLVPG